MAKRQKTKRPSPAWARPLRDNLRRRTLPEHTIPACQPDVGAQQRAQRVYSTLSLAPAEPAHDRTQKTRVRNREPARQQPITTVHRQRDATVKSRMQVNSLHRHERTTGTRASPLHAEAMANRSPRPDPVMPYRPGSTACIFPVRQRVRPSLDSAPFWAVGSSRQSSQNHGSRSDPKSK